MPNRRSYWTPETPVVELCPAERVLYAADIRSMVTDSSLTYTWLIHQLADEGLITDKFEMSNVVNGIRTGGKADEILRRSRSILMRYRTAMACAKHDERISGRKAGTG